MTMQATAPTTLNKQQLIERKAELSKVPSDERDDAYKLEWQQTCDTISRINNSENAAKMKKFAEACKPLMATREDSKGNLVPTAGANLTGIIINAVAAHHSGGFAGKDKKNTGDFAAVIAKMCNEDKALLKSSVLAVEGIFAAAVDAVTTDRALEVSIIMGVKSSKAGDRNEALRTLAGSL